LGLCDFQVARPARVRSLQWGRRRNFDGWKASGSLAGAETQTALNGYLTEPHACPSPDGQRAIFASNWPDKTGPVAYRRATQTMATILPAPSAVARGRRKALNVPAKIAKSRRVGRSGVRQEGRGNVRRGCPRAGRVAFDRDHPVPRWIPRQNRTRQAHQLG
jgi:hypothetical protein